MAGLNLKTRCDVRSITVLMPAFNEADNLPFVLNEAAEVLGGLTDVWNIVVVDDGSTDGTRGVMADLQSTMPQINYVRLRRNFGKSEALRVGFSVVDADIVVLMDADGQDDPHELANLIATIDSGYDLVTGRRSIRNDRFIKRNTSKVYNSVTARVSGVDGKDFNSGFKVMKGEVAKALEMYGELHRYIPVLAAWAGYRVTEVDVEHRVRNAGRSKFGRSRFWRGFLDLVTVKFLTTYDTRPFHLIGGLGILLGFVGLGLIAWMGILKIAGEGIGTRPALTIGVLCTVVAVQLISVGLLAELFVHLRRRNLTDSVAESNGG